jgi:pyruvate dehydrogenase E2 component (dihydrolipoamide acetyltransferase)
MPALSPTMTEGKLARWLKKTGDSVNPGDVIAEIETDKATMEVEAVDEGTIGEIRVAEGTENVAVNSIIAVMLGEGESESDIAKAAAPLVKLQPVAEAQKVSSAPSQYVTSAPAQPVARKEGRIIASPLAKRVANERFIDLSRVTGTGPNGRIVLADLNSFHRAPVQDAAPKPSPIEGRKLADLLGMKYTAQPNSTVRKTIARRLTEAKQSVPHFYLTVDCDIGALSALRQSMNEKAAAANEGVKLSINDFVIRASALALKKIPAANASWTDNDILLFDHADISVAVATDNGLITPIIKAAETKTVTAISKEMKDLGLRARAGKLKPEEFQGGSFSISNLGMFGIREFAAIINPPQACILAVGAGEQRAIVKNGKIEIGTMMTCTLSVDHRAVDGAIGAEYLAAFKKLIEEPQGLV